MGTRGDVERGLDENFETRCEVCGAALTVAEIEVARERGRPFACAIHAAELLPADELAQEDDRADAP